MEIDIFDSALEHEHGIASICLNDEIKFLQSKYHAQIKDIKPISSLAGGEIDRPYPYLLTVLRQKVEENR